METADFLIIGAGIVGLTLARELRRRHPRAGIVLWEKESAPGLHASGRNSGVLHSGIYYTPGTLKARFCAEGNRRMIAFAEERQIPYRRAGKVILAAEESGTESLDRLMDNARGNGIWAERLDAPGVRSLEPKAAPVPGIYCRDTGVIDPRAVLAALSRDLKSSEVRIDFGREASAWEETPGRLRDTDGGGISFGRLFNCAGAHADRVARLFGAGRDWFSVPFKGLYYGVKGDLVKESLYPVPDLDFPFLGVHLTRDVHGDLHAGPTILPALGRENYGLFSGARWGEAFGVAGQWVRLGVSGGVRFRCLILRELAKGWKRNFLTALRKLVPGVEASDLTPDPKVGIRPQLVHRGRGTLEMDFVVEATPKAVHVLNAVSPAFTCSFAFADHLAGLEAVAP
jgi:L-2-hydroxyglutarate oxidase LhgO